MATKLEDFLLRMYIQEDDQNSIFFALSRPIPLLLL